MDRSLTINQLHKEGLVVREFDPTLTPKGRQWLRTLEDIETKEVADAGEAAADLVLSTNGLFR